MTILLTSFIHHSNYCTNV